LANINWDVAFHFDPLTLRPAPSGGVAVPTYGEYGGPDYSEGAFGPLVAPYEPPADALDALFLAHDIASDAAATPAQQAAADLGLLRGVVALGPADLDPEGSVYAGLTTLTMVGHLAAEGGLGLLSRGELSRAVLDAADDIGRGLAGLDPGEREQAQDWLRAATDATGLHFADAVGWLGLVHGDWLA
jgi:hypothetical protein